MKHVLSLLLSILCVASYGQSAGGGVKGKLFVSVDDKAEIFVNGALFHQAPLNESESQEFELKPGDRFVVQLKNTLGKGRFMMLFMSTDRKQMAAFRKTSFRIMPDPTQKDFAPADLAAFKKQAKEVTGDFGKPYLLPFKSTSEWVWGEENISALACVCSKEMLKPNPRP